MYATHGVGTFEVTKKALAKKGSSIHAARDVHIYIHLSNMSANLLVYMCVLAINSEFTSHQKYTMTTCNGILQ